MTIKPIHPTALPSGLPENATVRLLLVAYHFPPSVSIGALRWEKLTRYLASSGYEIDVLTLDPLALDKKDPTRLSRLPNGIRVFAIPSTRSVVERVWNTLSVVTRRFRSAGPVGHRSPGASTESDHHTDSPRSRVLGARASINARLHVANELAWAKKAARLGNLLAQSRRYLAVITSGPPHYSHVSGNLISRRSRVPHLVDFRDPWSLAESIPRDMDSPIWASLASRYEARVVNQATSVIMNTEAAAVEMRALYPAIASRVISVMNGSDPEDIVQSPLRDRFTVLYAGSLYLQRDPRAIFRACAPIVKEFALSPAQFAIEFLGPSSSFEGISVLEIAESFGLRAHVSVAGQVSRSDAIARAAAAALLVCLPDGQRLTIQAKLFEYVQLDAWLLVFADRKSAMSQALDGFDVDVVPPSDVQLAIDSVRARWLQFASGIRPLAIGRNGEFSREAQAERIRQVLENLAAPVVDQQSRSQSSES